MAKAIGVVLPKWLIDLKNHPDHPDESLYRLILPLLQWQSISFIEKYLLAYAAGSGILFQLETLFQDLQLAPNPLMARLSLSTYSPGQVFLTIATEEEKPTTVTIYVLRTTEAGRIEGIRIAPENPAAK